MARPTTKLQVSVTAASFKGGTKTRIDNLAGMEKLELGDIQEMIEILEITGVGQEKRQRAIQGLKDIADFTMSGLFDPDRGDNSFFKMWHSIFEAEEKATVEITWAPGALISVEVLCGNVTIPTPVGDFVSSSAALSSKGTWTITLP